MSDDKSKLSRRALLQGLGAATILSLLPKSASAETTGTAETTATAAAFSPPDKKASGSHRIVTANILLASPTYEGTPNAWANRRALCEKVLRDQNADIICMQEVLRPQAEDLKETFSSYQQFGFPGPFMDAHPDGYHGVTKNVLMFSKERYELTSAGGFWLSETPLIAGSVSWDALRGRHVNWVRLKDRQTGREFRVIDTHLDHKGQVARENQARIIVNESKTYMGDFPQVLCGDFNVDMTNPAYATVTGGGWTDTYTAIHGPKDPGRTFHGLLGPAYKPKKKGGKIDFIFCRGQVKPLGSKIIRDNDNGRYPSDHYFLSADLEL